MGYWLSNTAARYLKGYIMKQVNLTDHQIAELIKEKCLKIRSSEGVQLGTNYYNNDDFSFELLIVLDNKTMEKKVFTCESDSVYNIDIE